MLALKGVFGSEAEPLVKSSRKYKGSPLILAVSNKIKALLFYRFRIQEAESPGFIHFDESLDLDWFEQLGAERMGRTYQRGQLTHTFKPVPGRRNEALDCMAYNVAAMAVLNVRNWDHLEKVQGSLRKKDEASEQQVQSPYETVQKDQGPLQLDRKRGRLNSLLGGSGKGGWMNRWK